MLRLLNSGTNKLDHLITNSKSFSDYSGVGYKGKSSGSKTVFFFKKKKFRLAC